MAAGRSDRPAAGHCHVVGLPRWRPSRRPSTAHVGQVYLTCPTWAALERCGGARSTRKPGGCPPPGAAVWPSSQPPPAVTRVLLPGRRLAGEGANTRRSRGLATDLIHQPPQGGWGLVEVEPGVRRFRRLPMRSEAAGDGSARAPAQHDAPDELRTERRVPLLKEPLQGSGVIWMARNPG